MSILHVIESGGGSADFILYLIKYLPQHHHTVIYGDRTFGKKVDQVIEENPNATFLYWRNVQREVNFLNDIKAFLSLFRLLKNLPANVIHLHSSKAGFLGRLACFILRKKNVIYTPNGLPFIRKDISRLKAKFYFLLEAFASLLTGNIICCSKSEAEEFIKRNINCTYINNGTELFDRDARSQTNQVLTIATCGRVTIQKNPALFNEIAQHFQRNQTIKFVWIGSGELEYLLDSENISVTGWLDHSSVLEILSASDIYISTASWEGLPFAVLEAMSLGKPLLLSNCVGNIDLVKDEHNGFVFNSKEEAIAKINLINDNRKLIESFGAQSRTLVSTDFEVKGMASKYESNYSNTAADDKDAKRATGWFENIFLLLLILTPASFPYSLRMSSILTTLLLVSWILNGGHKNLVLLRKKSIILFSLLFIVPAVSLLYSESKDFSLLEKRLFLLVYPIIVYTSRLSSRVVIATMYSFISGCTVAALYALVRSIQNPALFGVEMTYFTIGITHVYFGLYLTLAIVFLFALIYKIYNKKYRSVAIVLHTFWALFLLAFLFILGGKMSIITLLSLAFIAGFGIAIKTKKWSLGISLFALPVILFILTIHYTPHIKTRFASLFISENYQPGDNYWNNIGSRVSSLKCNFEIFNKYPLFGAGIGDVQDELDNCNAQLGYLTLQGMNSHNQYLQFLLGTGIFGLSVFLATMVYLFRCAYLNRNTLYLCFVYIFCSCCLTESLLERQHGILLFAFFHSLLFIHNNDKR